MAVQFYLAHSVAQRRQLIILHLHLVILRLAQPIAAAGSDTNIVLTLSGKGTGGVTVQGTTAAGNASAGYVGEYLSTIVLVGSPVNLSTNNTVNVATLSLTAGDWDVWGEVWPTGPSGTSWTAFWGQISTSSATTVSVPGDGNSYTQMPVQSAYITGTHTFQILTLDPCRINVSTTTNVYLGAGATFTVHTAQAYGKICARRVR